MMTTDAALTAPEILQSFKNLKGGVAQGFEQGIGRDIEYENLFGKLCENFKSAEVVYIQDEEYSCSHANATVYVVKPGVLCTISNDVHHDAIIVVEEKANVQYHSIIDFAESGKKYFGVAILMQNSKLDWIDASCGNAVDIKHSIILKGRGAEAKYRSMFLASNDEKYNIDVEAVHAADNTNSSLFTRSALFNKSTGCYRGKIKVLPAANNCNARLCEDTLLLGKDARISAIPILEIANDNVRCSHGVTITQASDEQLFYLQARGILLSEAKRMLIAGFFDQMIISTGDFGLAVKERIMKKLLGEKYGQC